MVEVLDSNRHRFIDVADADADADAALVKTIAKITLQIKWTRLMAMGAMVGWGW